MRKIIRNAYVLTPAGIVPECDILLDGSVISTVGQLKNEHADEEYDGSGKLAIPGLINCHTHSYMSLFRCIGDDLSFNEWLFDAIMPLEDKMTGEDAYWCTLLSCIEMIKSGTTAFVDMHMFESSCARATSEIGMRAVMTRGLSGSDFITGGERRINEALRECKEFEGDKKIGFMLAPHSIYTCDKAYLQRISALAKELDCGIHMHLSETQTEFDDCLAQHNMTPVEYSDSLGLLTGKTLAAHCVKLTDNDIDILAARKVSVVTNPKSNLKLGNGIAPISALREKGVRVLIGTDSCASNNSLNLFSEMSFASLLQKGATGCCTSLPAKEVFSFATSEASDALGLNCGVIEAGREADIVLLDISAPHLIPRNDLLSSLVYCANGSEPDTVFIAGEPVMVGRKILRANEDKVKEKVNAIVNRIRGNGNV